jgi:rubrerythrin
MQTIEEFSVYAVKLEEEAAGLNGYQHIHDTSDDPEICVMAREFADMEAEHVAELTKWITNPRQLQSANG